MNTVCMPTSSTPEKQLLIAQLFLLYIAKHTVIFLHLLYSLNEFNCWLLCRFSFQGHFLHFFANAFVIYTDAFIIIISLTFLFQIWDILTWVQLEQFFCECNRNYFHRLSIRQDDLSTNSCIDWLSISRSLAFLIQIVVY